jgi:putative PEP-CTERM system histidine kinase
VRRNPEWSLEIFVSRQVVFYSGAVVSVGIYLLLMSFGGFYVRQIGGEWGRIGQLLFFSGAVIVLLALVFSVAVRRHARVFIEKHFFKNKYDYRVEWLRFIGTMSSANEADVRRRSLHAITQIFSCPGGILFLEDDAAKNIVPVASWPMEIHSFSSLTELSRDEPLCEFLGRRQWVLDLAEYATYPERYDSITLPVSIVALPSARVVSPLIELNHLIGFVVLFEPPPPFTLTYEDRDLLKTVGRHIATQIMQHQADRKLAVSRQFEAYNQLTAFMMHDLKNSVAQLRLLVDNAARHKHNPEFIDDAIATIANTVERMTRLIEQLKRGGETTARVTVACDDILRKAIARCSDRQPAPQFQGETHRYVVADAERLTAVFEHLIRNSQDATSADGRVWLEIELTDATVTVTIHDSGIGMDAQFVRERLFRPFDSTKGSKGMGIGAYQVRQYVRELGGDVEVRSSPGQGTSISVRLPIASEPNLRYSHASVSPT